MVYDVGGKTVYYVEVNEVGKLGKRCYTVLRLQDM